MALEGSDHSVAKLQYEARWPEDLGTLPGHELQQDLAPDALFLVALHTTLEKFNRVHKLIEIGSFDQKPASDIWFEISKHHLGNTPYEHMLASVNDPEGANLRSLALGIKPYGSASYETRAHRTSQIKEMMRVSKFANMPDVLIGVPTQILEEAFQSVCTAADDIIANQEYSPTDKVRLLAALCPIMITLHPRPDANSRSTHDWFVALQRKIANCQELDSAGSVVRGWLTDGLAHKNAATYIKDKEQRDIYLEKNIAYQQRRRVLDPCLNYFFSIVSRHSLPKLGSEERASLGSRLDTLLATDSQIQHSLLQSIQEVAKDIADGMPPQEFDGFGEYVVGLGPYQYKHIPETTLTELEWQEQQGRYRPGLIQ